MLLVLPSELIQIVLLNCTTPAFLQAAWTCRTLYEIALGCRETLIHHIERTPGPYLDTSSFSTCQLLPLLKARASKQLYGSQLDAGCTSFGFVDRAFNIKAWSLVSHANQTLIFATARGQSAVQILQISGGQLLPVSHAKLPWDQHGSIEILKTAFNGGDEIYVLHKFTPCTDEEDLDADHHPFVRHARESGSDGYIYLTCHSLQNPYGKVRITNLPDHEGFEPSALAVATGGSFAIAWCHRMLSDHSVVHYSVIEGSDYDISPNLVGFSHSPRKLRRWDDDDSTRGPLIRELAFNDKSTQMLYYYQATSLYASYQKLEESRSQSLHQNSTLVRFTDDLRLLFSIDIPFFGTHETSDFVGYSACRWSYLALGIATHRKEEWTVACLLRSEATCQARNCEHVLNLDRGRRLTNWTVAARLWGFRKSTDSLGCRVATSREGTRIAIANWNVVYVWALEPGALVDMDPEDYYHPSSRSPSTGQIELHPIVLNLDAVCFKLRFTEQENELVVVTDRGIALWNLSQTARGMRTCQQLTI